MQEHQEIKHLQPTKLKVLKEVKKLVVLEKIKEECPKFLLPRLIVRKYKKCL